VPTAGPRTTRPRPPARLVGWLLPAGVVLLLGLGTLASVVRQSASLSTHRVDAHGVGWLLGGLVILAFVFGAVLLVLGFSQLDLEGRPPEPRKGNWVVRIVCALLLAAGILYFMWRPPHQVDATLNHVQNGAPAPRPAATVDVTPPAPAGNGQGGGLTSVVGSVVMIAIVLVIVVGIVVGIGIALRAMRYRRAPEEVGPERDTDLVAVVDAARAATYADSGPRAVIIGCYEAFERELARSGLTRDAAQTPSSVLAEAVEGGLLGRRGAAAASDLVRLFERARFAPHPITEADVERARADLDGIRAGLAGAEREPEPAESAVRTDTR
jgi:hypothetical protein